MLMPEDEAESLFYTQDYAGGEGAEWASLPYWHWNVGLSGCGLCSATMCIDLLTNRHLTPRDVLRRYRADGMDSPDDSKVGGQNMATRLNAYNQRAFGVRSSTLPRNVDAFRRALKAGDVIWASSSDRQHTHPWRFADGSRQPLGEGGIQHLHGHIVCVWHYDEKSRTFLVKDPIDRRELCNNVPYTEGQLALWLAGNDHQQFRVTLAG